MAVSNTRRVLTLQLSIISVLLWNKQVGRGYLHRTSLYIYIYIYIYTKTLNIRINTYCTSEYA